MQNSFTARLRELRGNKSQAVFARELGVIQQTYARWENGQNEPSIEKIKKNRAQFLTFPLHARMSLRAIKRV